jgi:hypothetical protein
MTFIFNSAIRSLSTSRPLLNSRIARRIGRLWAGSLFAFARLPVRLPSRLRVVRCVAWLFHHSESKTSFQPVNSIRQFPRVQYRYQLRNDSVSAATRILKMIGENQTNLTQRIQDQLLIGHDKCQPPLTMNEDIAASLGYNRSRCLT